jgi:hypothetical protein
MWASLAATAPMTRPSYVIVNVGTGPGTTLDSDYVAAITSAEAAGWTMLGYVDTARASASVCSVESQVEQWRWLYGVQDIFFDQVTGDEADLRYYGTLTGHVRSLGGVAVLNPGVPPATGYLSTNVCHGIVVMEGTLAAFRSSPPPKYSGPPVKIAYIITSGPSQADLLPTLQAIKARGGNLVYVSDQGNSYDGLPSYFAAENGHF